jgi:alkylated DNA repair dioxygenase AlkB
MMNSPNDVPTKHCACTGVRWCANCLDPRIRRSHRMDDPIRIPDFLRRRPHSPALNPNSPDRIHDFDLDLQSVPSCADFEGVHVFRGFISPNEGDQLLREIEAKPFMPAQSGKLKQHYGPKVNFNKQRVNATDFRGLPDYAYRIESRLRKLVAQDQFCGAAGLRAALEAFEPTDTFVMRYHERDASNLDFHRDDVFAYGEAILDISLESDSVLTFLNCRDIDAESTSTDCIRVPLPARSLAVIYGRARFDWDHAILAYDIDGRRTSITMRALSEPLRQTEAGKHILDVVRGKQIPR